MFRFFVNIVDFNKGLINFLIYMTRRKNGKMLLFLVYTPVHISLQESTGRGQTFVPLNVSRKRLDTLLWEINAPEC